MIFVCVFLYKSVLFSVNGQVFGYSGVISHGRGWWEDAGNGGSHLVDGWLVKRV